MIELRVLTADDWALWRELRLAALTEAPYAFASRLSDWQGEHDNEQRWRARLEMAGSYNLAAMIDGHPIGMASGVPTDEPATIELIAMWVNPKARGKGVGDRLVNEIATWAEKIGAKILRLGVAEGNPAAAELYRRNGFQDTGGIGDSMPDGVSRERRMEKQLRTSTG
ncbi:GNAT family N-acetyltransferase [Glycomyces sp. NRRL B-16210]|uniref:GNAT family N-acetyltransferase n=1 Tax=Glycomyces sp. NRRL B-16210 TaxID=1463821 RepID=UPI0004C1D752|nr:GNAT family N-acetyltransferase [Glycomyces sp. NRRL B-16210]